MWWGLPGFREKGDPMVGLRRMQSRAIVCPEIAQESSGPGSVTDLSLATFPLLSLASTECFSATVASVRQHICGLDGVGHLSNAANHGGAGL